MMASHASRIPRRTRFTKQTEIPRTSCVDDKTFVVSKENKDPEPRKNSGRNPTRKLSSVTGEVRRRHLSLVDSNKPTSGRSSIADEIEDIDLSNLVFAEEESGLPAKSHSHHKKVLNNGDRKSTEEPLLKAHLPPATAILTSGPPDSANSTPPFPPPTTAVSSIVSPATPVLSPDTRPRDLPADVVNIELEDGLYEYSAEVIVYLRKLEKRFLQPEDYLDNNEVKGAQRAILVDWLLQVQHYLKLGQETLHIGVRVLDMVLTRREVQSKKLQLVGISALLIASKMEEYYQADIKKLLHLTENSYSKMEVVHMETILLEVVDFQVYFPTPQDFLPRYTRAALRSEDKEFMKTCQLLVDSHLPSPSNACLAPSLLAAAAVYTTSLLYNLSANQGFPPTIDLWTPTLRHFTDYVEGEVAPISLSMVDMFSCSEYNGARNKYRSNSQHGRLILANHLQEAVVRRARQFLLYIVGGEGSS